MNEYRRREEEVGRRDVEDGRKEEGGKRKDERSERRKEEGGIEESEREGGRPTKSPGFASRVTPQRNCASLSSRACRTRACNCVTKRTEEFEELLLDWMQCHLQAFE